MKIEMFTRSENQLERNEYNDKVLIMINDNLVFKVEDGEIDDNYLWKNFKDVYQIPQLLNKAYLAGVAGEGISIEIKDIEE